MPAEVYTVSKIQIAPLKSGGLMELSVAWMAPEGMQTIDGGVKDHEYFAVRYKPDQNGIHQFVTQRSSDIPDDPDGKKDNHRKLALVRPSYEENGHRWGWGHIDNQQVAVEQPREDCEVRKIQLWDHIGYAMEMPHLTEWLNDVADTDLRVMRTVGPWYRQVRQNYVANPHTLRAQDGYPIHAILSADVRAVSAGAGVDIPSDRFRAQLELEGGEVWSLHDIYEGEIEGTHITQPKPCGRCPMPGFDQQTGNPSKLKPLAHIDKMRPRWISKSGDLDIIFGENWIVDRGVMVRKGSEFRPTELRNPPLKYASQ